MASMSWQSMWLRSRRQAPPFGTSAWAGQAGKMLVPLLGVLTLLAVAVAGIAIYLQMGEREKRVATEQQLSMVSAENETLKGQLQEVQELKARLEDDLALARKEVARSEESLAKAVEAQEILSRSVEDRQHEIDRLTKEMEGARHETEQLTAQLTELQTERETIKQQLTDLERAKSQLEAKVMELSGRPTVELEKVRVTSEGAGLGGGIPLPVSATSGSVPEGTVKVVNREYDFIVMDLGKNDGLSVGQEFQIVRENQVLGRVKVEKVYDEIAAAALLPDSKKDHIQKGDSLKPL